MPRNFTRTIAAIAAYDEAMEIDNKQQKYIICGQGHTANRVDVVIHDPTKSKNTYYPGKWTIDSY